MTTQTTKVRNGTITLPKNLRRTWKGAEVFIFPSKDTLLVKKIQKPLSQLSDLASRISSQKMNREEINKEIQVYRKK